MIITGEEEMRSKSTKENMTYNEGEKRREEKIREGREERGERRREGREKKKRRQCRGDVQSSLKRYLEESNRFVFEETKI